jgi:lysophospholipase L1-like esterase
LYRLKLYFEKASPHYLFLQVGVNDLKVIGIVPQREAEIVNACIQNIKTILSESLARGVLPVFLTIIPHGQVEILRRPIWSPGINRAIKRVNNEIKEYAENLDIQVIDAASCLENIHGIVKRQFQKDCLHLNRNGYETLNNCLIEYMKRTNENTSDLSC